MNTNTVISKKDLYVTSPLLLFWSVMNVSVSYGWRKGKYSLTWFLRS